MKQECKEALKCHKSGELQQAKLMYEKILSEFPDDVDALHLLGILLAQKQDFAPARAYITRALQIGPVTSVLHNNMGNILVALGELDGALLHYQEAQRLRPDDPIVYDNLANLYGKLNQLDTALSFYQQALHLSPDNIDINYHLGLLYFKQESFIQAKKCFAKVIALQPRHAAAQCGLAQVLQQEGESDLAAKHYQRSLRADSSNVIAQNNLGMLLSAKQKYAAAIRHFKKILQFEPKNTMAFYNIGAVFLKQNNPEAALKYFLQLTQLEPTFDVYYNLGVVYMDLNRYDDAILYFSKALELKPHDIATNTNLGSVYLKKQDYANAARCYQVVANFDSANKEVNYILAALSQKQLPARAPKEYVQNLFNQYARNFDQHLEFLHYKAPEALYDAVIKIIGFCREKLQILDLGCGTGLCGEKFHGVAQKLIGIDLSEKMVEVAARKKIYSELNVAAIEDVLGNYHDIDLITAADTFVYVGSLAEIFSLCFVALKTGGLCAFTVERTEIYPYELQKSMRFAHNEKYIEECAKRNKFTILCQENIILREEHNQPISSALYVLRKINTDLNC